VVVLSVSLSICVCVCVCSDVDECLIIPGSCGNGTCQNIPGRYTCVCDRGFEDPMNMQMCMGEICSHSLICTYVSTESALSEVLPVNDSVFSPM